MVIIKRKSKLIVSTVAVTILIILLSILGFYYICFSPKVPVMSIDTNIKEDKMGLVKKFLPRDFSLSLSEIYVESNTTFTQTELNELFISAIREIPELKGIVTGIGVYTNKEYINIFIGLKYKKIPLEGRLKFSCKAENGKGILHFEEGNIGVISIGKEMIFKEDLQTSILETNKETGDIILTFNTIKQLEVRGFRTVDDGINIVFRGTIRFWDWLKK